ncbi:MAG: lipoprotein signal peptidase [Bacteroidaceae bacterium]|nr:lipoprotein signal peptidase [Bacteroidaceae bacterium]
MPHSASRSRTTRNVNTDSPATLSTLTTNNKRWQAATVAAIFIGFLAIDQIVKVWVKTHMALHESRRVTDWFYITFIENNGMAFGMEFFDKLFLTGFRLVATCFVGYYMARLIRRGVSWGYLICLAFIMTGAAGNIIDCLFYGLIFDNPAWPQVAQFVPFGEGYSTWFYGRVVDMFYFPLCEWDWPAWVPFVGGSHYVFFSYIFNVADACISCGVIALLLFYRRTLSEELKVEKGES